MHFTDEHKFKFKWSGYIDVEWNWLRDGMEYNQEEGISHLFINEIDSAPVIRSLRVFMINNLQNI